MTVQAAPGVVLSVWTSASLAADLIRTGEALAGEPAVANHVILVTHLDARGRWTGIQGQPGGVGLADCTPYLSDPRTRGNYEQVRWMNRTRSAFGGELQIYLASCAASLGIGYDWCGIAEDAAAALRLNVLKQALDKVYGWPAPHGQIPGEMVCSSLAAWQYEHVSWPHPDTGAERTCTPADWWDWCDRQAWAGAG